MTTPGPDPAPDARLRADLAAVVVLLVAAFLAPLVLRDPLASDTGAGLVRYVLVSLSVAVVARMVVLSIMSVGTSPARPPEG